MRLQNKAAVITGGSRGIGFAIADAFLREGTKLALCGSRIESAKKAAEQLKVKYPQADILPLGADMKDGKSIDAMISAAAAHLGRLDILVNNAGVTSSQPIFELSDEEFDSVVRINLGGPFRCIRAAAKIMREQGGGSIINTSSIVGTYGGKMQSAYSASKFAVNGLTKSCAKELGVFGIRVNAVAPGVVGTDMVAQSVTPQMQAGLQSLTPLGRIAGPEELAGIYVYLASDEASFTTGAIIHVDGGIVL